MFKYPLHSFQQALLVLRRKCLRKALVGIGKGDGQRIPGMFHSVPVVVHELSKVHLTPSCRMVNGQEPRLAGSHDKALLAHIPFHAGIAARIAFFLTQAVIYPSGSVPLFPRNLTVCFHPLIDVRNIRSKNRVIFRCHVGKRILAPIFLVCVFLYLSMMRDDWDEDEEWDEEEAPESIYDLALTNNVISALARNGIETIEDLCSKTPYDLLALKGIGMKSVEMISEELEYHGLGLKKE